MAGNQYNIIVGAATLAVDGTDVGLTQGGVQIRKQKEQFDVDADQMGGVARKVQTFERMFLTTTLLEATQRNMQLAFNEPNSNLSGGSALNFGTGSFENLEHTLTVVGKAPGNPNKTRTYTFYRAVCTDEVTHMVGARDQAGILAFGCELLKDATQGYRFGTYIDT